jgi:hypothetical protein
MHWEQLLRLELANCQKTAADLETPAPWLIDGSRRIYGWAIQTSLCMAIRRYALRVPA